MITNKVSKATFLGNNVATKFPFTFKVWKKEYMIVEITDPEELTTVATGWTVVLTDTGGEITYLHHGSPLPHGYKLTILRNMPFTQGTDLISGTRFDPEVIEDSLDKKTAELQQLDEKLQRAITVPASSEENPDNYAARLFAAKDLAEQKASEASQSAQEAKDFLDSGITDLEANRTQAISDIENKRDSSLQNIEDSRASALLEVGAQVDIATTKASEASQSAQEASNSEEEARKWATGTQEERPEGSAKAWAEKAEQAVQQENVTVPGTLAFNNLKLGADGTVTMSAEDLEWLNNFSYFGNEQYNMDTTTYTKFNATFANPKAEARYLAFTPAIYQAWKKLSIEENIDWINMTDAEYNTWKNNI